MTTSLSNPRADFEINTVGGHNLLEAVRRWAPQAHIIYSSTNKVYGSLDQVRIREAATRYVADNYEFGFDETLSLDFQSPYGCSKGAIDQYMLDYHRMFGLRTTVFRHSSVFGIRQYGTIDQGWIGWFLQQALMTQKNFGHRFTICGDGKQVRDVLFSNDLVSCYFMALEAGTTVAGQVFNIGGGMPNSLSLLELFSFLDRELGICLQYDHLPWRQSDQRVFVADIRKANRIFGWQPATSFQQGLTAALAWSRNEV
jgi:CDP-paratose 2-epimerase